MKERNETYLTNYNDWPIHKLSQDRDQFVEDISNHTIERIRQQYRDKLSDLLAKVIYLERRRIRENPWKADPPHEIKFWNQMRQSLLRDALDKEDQQEAEMNELIILKKIVNRYANEIPGGFKVSTYKFARKFLTSFFNRLLSANSERYLRRLYGARTKLRERLKLKGDLDHLRKLSKKGTMVFVPTHFSHLDSILVGWSVDSIGIPAVIYGAGLNLYNSNILAYFMKRLGAYTLDRRKKNEIYLEALKGHSKLAMERGVETLFFPGGTRERSGQVEQKLKMGLLGTTVEAQRSLYMKGEDRKLFIVPVVIGYNFVLEAKQLIDDHLKREGKERYITEKSDVTVFRTLKFLWKLMNSTSEIQLSFGKPLDVLGNFIDQEGNSLDQHGRPVELKDYFISNGGLKADMQRDMVYTRQLASVLVDRYHRENIALSSHVVAFVAFNMLKARNKNLDLYGLLRLAAEDRKFDFEAFKKATEAFQAILLEYRDHDHIKVS
ncbi:MAG: 1-acyl-sn-glycerol-3-phosphate acyltransferase, partial [Bacteroidota bacterium]